MNILSIQCITNKRAYDNCAAYIYRVAMYMSYPFQSTTLIRFPFYVRIKKETLMLV